jgi:hypothetical protein
MISPQFGQIFSANVGVPLILPEPGHPETAICHSSIILPSVPSVTTRSGIVFTLFFKAVLTAFSIPPQHGTSIRTTVIDCMAFAAMIADNFSL